MQPGDVIQVTVGHFIPGGHAIAHADGRTLFVRHGIPGEVVRVRVTEVSTKAIRADVIDVIVAAATRVQPPCSLAGVCGGCDFQHIQLSEQRRIKADVLQDALRRQAHVDRVVPVEPVPGDTDGLRWRTRIRWQHDTSGRRGFYRHRSHEVIPVGDCLIATTDARPVQPGDPFSQVHRGIGAVLRSVVLEFGQPTASEVWWDLYGGSGLFAREFAARGAEVHVVDTCVPALEALAACAPANITAHASDVATWLQAWAGSADGVIVDPPRTGLDRSVADAISKIAPRTIVMVSCDAVTFARDLERFMAHGYTMEQIRAFDAFPMTRHIEIVASLSRA